MVGAGRGSGYVSLITSAVSVDSDLRKCRITEHEKRSSSCPVRVYLSGLSSEVKSKTQSRVLNDPSKILKIELTGLLH